MYQTLVSNSTKNFLDLSLNVAAIVLFTSIFLVVLAQIFFRYVLNSPLIWTGELARYLFIWLSFTGWIIASRRGDHITITVLRDRFPTWLGKLAALVIQFSHITLAMILVWHGSILFRRNLSVETVTLFFPFALVYLIVPLAGILITFIALEGIVKTLRGTMP